METPWRSARALVGGLLCFTAACAQQPRQTGTIGFESGDVPVQTQPGQVTSCRDGEVRCCDLLLGEHSGVRSCYRGTQTCSGGVFGPCGDGTVAIRSGVSPAPSAMDSPAVATASLSTPKDCAKNPCDPSCQQFEETPDGGISPPVTLVGSYQGGSVENLPGGFQSKGLKDSSHPPSGACTRASDCQFDYRCNVQTGLCEPWSPGGVDPACSGVDMTLGPTCNGVIPVCNRGNTEAPAGLELIVFSGNSNQMQDNLGLCSGFSGSIASRCKTTAPVAPGQCLQVSGCTLNGTESIVINAAAPPSTVSPIAECDCGNNWTVYHNGGPCVTQKILASAPVEVRQVYEAQCPPATTPQWGYLRYSAATPANPSGSSKIRIQAHTAAKTAALSPDCSDCAIVADVPASAPAVCGAGPAPCPLDLYLALGGHPAANAPVLELVFTLSPTPDATVSPMLSTWELTYSCAEDE